MSMTDHEATVGHVVQQHVADDLIVEQQRKASIEARSIAVITSSATLVTLLLGLAALVTQKESFSLDAGPRVLLCLGAAFFVLSAVLAIMCGSPRGYLQIDPMSLKVLVTPETWTAPAVDAERELTAARLVELLDSRSRNQRKARLLVAALLGQVTAILATAVAVALILGKT